jgi:hypothetical protein
MAPVLDERDVSPHGDQNRWIDRTGDLVHVARRESSPPECKGLVLRYGGPSETHDGARKDLFRSLPPSRGLGCAERSRARAAWPRRELDGPGATCRARAKGSRRPACAATTHPSCSRPAGLP